MKVLFLGPDWYGSNARSMATGFAAAGHEVRIVDTTAISRPAPLTIPWFSLKFPRLKIRDESLVILRAARDVVRSWKPDLLFCFKTVNLRQADLLSLDIPVKVHYSPDDVSNPINVTPDYLRYESLWDLVVTTKRHNISEIQARSSARTLFVWSAYDPNWHHREGLRAPFREYDAGFIGNARPDRVELMKSLARRFGRSLVVSGEKWSRASPLLARSATVVGPSYGEDFSRVVASTRANLVLLNSDNRDTHTCRSFEVPAAGGLVLAERTLEHQELLEEDAEAVFFDGPDELLDKLASIVRHPQRYEQIRERGHRRMIEGQHTYCDRVVQIVAELP
jgi:spore maturation protein CgeB